VTSRLTWCDRTLLTSSCHFALCTTDKAFQRELRRLKVDQDVTFMKNAHSAATTHIFECEVAGRKKHCAIVCMPVPPSDRTGIQIAALLVHEAMHIWRCVRHDLGEHDPSSELEAYAMQNISQELMQAYADQVKPKRKR